MMKYFSVRLILMMLTGIISTKSYSQALTPIDSSEICEANTIFTMPEGWRLDAPDVLVNTHNYSFHYLVSGIFDIYNQRDDIKDAFNL